MQHPYTVYLTSQKRHYAVKDFAHMIPFKGRHVFILIFHITKQAHTYILMAPSIMDNIYTCLCT